MVRLKIDKLVNVIKYLIRCP